MIFGKTKLELKVGIFVFAGLAILVIFILSIGNIGTWEQRHRLYFQFSFVNGVKVGAPVRVAGVDAGEVREIKINYNPQEAKTDIVICCMVNKNVQIPKDSTVWVNTLGLLGEKYVEIMPGKDYASCLQPEETLLGKDPIPMHEVTALAKDIVANLDESIVRINKKEGTVGKLLYDDTVYNELEALVTDLRKHPWKLFWKTKENK